MTSMLVTLSSASAAVMFLGRSQIFARPPLPSPCGPCGRGRGPLRSSGRGRWLFHFRRLGGAVARLDALLGGVFQRRFLVGLAQLLVMRLDPVRSGGPMCAVPLDDAHVAIALVILAA